MTSDTLEIEIKESVYELLKLARSLAWNSISENCKFILTEIEDSDTNFYKKRLLRNRENKRKVPTMLSDLMPTIKGLYNNLYDINLYIYKAEKHITVIEIRYYTKSSLDKEYREKVIDASPMLHCKVALPPWSKDNKEKFDINWEHKPWLIRWKMFRLHSV